MRACLEAAGYRVHAYISPHLVRFHERIRLVGRLIDEEALIALLEECEHFNGDAPITFFEITTAAAFLAFARTPERLKVALEYRVDAALTDCPSQAELSTSVAKQLGYEPFSTELPAHRLADEPHQTLDGKKVYIATTVGSGCVLGAEPAPTAGTDDLKAASGLFKEEARDIAPE